jgi:hypothetical protein
MHSNEDFGGAMFGVVIDARERLNLRGVHDRIDETQFLALFVQFCENIGTEKIDDEKTKGDFKHL